MAVDMLKKIKTGILFGVLFLLITVSGVTVHAQENAISSRAGGYYTVIFHQGDGSVNTAYRKLKVKVKENGVIKLPELPAKKGYKNVGWAMKKNVSSAQKKAGDRIRVSRNLNYYAVQKKAMPVVFHKNDGSILKTDYVLKGRYMPAMKNRPGYTFLGWSRRPNQQTSPDYVEGEYVSVTQPTHLYAVEFDRSLERNISPFSLPQPDGNKYGKVIFVGDSRTVMMRSVLREQCSEAQLERLAFVCESGRALDWFKETGYTMLLREIKSARQKYPDKPVAVVFNLGVNDLRNYHGPVPDGERIGNVYRKYMNQIDDVLEKKGCRLFYMSVNPVNGCMSIPAGARKESEICRFNNYLRTNLSGSYTFINVHDWMQSTGFSTTRRYWDPSIRDDGLHYTEQTYKRIYACCMNKLNKL